MPASGEVPMIRNYQSMPNDAAIHTLAIRDSNSLGDRLGNPATWKKWQAYYFTGLEHRMLVCPAVFAADESLVQRPGLYLKTNLPLAGLVYLTGSSANNYWNTFLDNLAWMADSYLFKFNSTRPPFYVQNSPRLYVDHNTFPNHGPTVFDDARVRATEKARDALGLLNFQHTSALIDFIKLNPSEIAVSNYAETSLLEEICTHTDLLAESLIYVDALVNQNPRLLAVSKLTYGWEQIICTKKYNRTVLSFYLASIKEPVPNSPGSYIGMFKNLYNILEYLMESEGKPGLRAVLRDRVGTARLEEILLKVKMSAHPQSSILQNLNNGERLSQNCVLPPLSENDADLVEKIAERLYTKRNAVLHSKKTHYGVPLDHNVRPGASEESQLETDLAIIRPIAEIIVEELDPND
jgi:hypothetical protein